MLNKANEIDIIDEDPAGYQPFRLVPGNDAQGLLLLCDHASSEMPANYGDLGVSDTDLTRHVSHDIGARDLTLALAERLNAPAVLGRFSRLLIDPNRGEDDPTLIMQISDRSVIPGNAHISEKEREYRLNTFYRPYHDAVTTRLDEMQAGGSAPMLFSVHSFTANWRGNIRPWHAGVLWDKDPRFAVPLIDALREDSAITVGDNEPYKGWLYGDTMYRHGTMRGLAHALIEVRQDLIGSPEGAAEWADRLAPILHDIIGREGLRTVKHFGSLSDGEAG